MKILIVEDDEKIASFIQKGLSEASYHASIVHDGKSALEFILNSHYDLIILDVMLPKLDGLSVLRELRSAGHQVPVLILSAKRSVEERVEGLGDGADDYLVKPFAFSELLMRVQVLLRRSKPFEALATSITYSEISMDLLKREVRRDGIKVDLQAKEFSLLEYFLRNPERVITKTMILENVYGYDFDTQTNLVDVLIFRLRNKIDKDFEKKILLTVRGVGYVLKNED